MQLSDTETSPADGLLRISKPYLLFLGDITDPLDAKTAFGLRDWCREDCIGELRLPHCRVTTGLPSLAPAEAYRRGARSLVIGVASFGGRVPVQWIPTLREALEAGLDLVSGMHTRLAHIETLRAAAQRHGRALHDVRHFGLPIPVATGTRRSGMRVLTVGTDCALGKKYTALAISAELKRRGVSVTFRATGQTGILIAGAGVAVDAVAADFIAGAAELLTPAAAPDHWYVIEGQGSILHPSYGGVSLGLLHGSQPDAFIACHDPRRSTIAGMEEFPIGSIEELIDLTIRLGRLTNPRIQCVGISLNTSAMNAMNREAVLDEYEQRIGLPAFDPMATRIDRVVDRLLRLYPSVAS
jgi:uncharacterized NAD-dependent epimerase/dehydratase family protein